MQSAALSVSQPSGDVTLAPGSERALRAAQIKASLACPFERVEQVDATDF